MDTLTIGFRMMWARQAVTKWVFRHTGLTQLDAGEQPRAFKSDDRRGRYTVAASGRWAAGDAARAAVGAALGVGAGAFDVEA